MVSVEKISEAYLLPALQILLDAFPFKIINFHSNYGGGYVNYMVAKFLNKLKIEMTKSRPRNSNDNALAEGKDAAIVRKIFVIRISLSLEKAVRFMMSINASVCR